MRPYLLACPCEVLSKIRVEINQDYRKVTANIFELRFDHNAKAALEDCAVAPAEILDLYHLPVIEV